MDASPCASPGGEGLPVVVRPWRCRGREDVDSIASLLEEGYYRLFGEWPGRDQRAAWTGSLSALLGELEGLRYPVLVEYPVLGGLDRIDFIVVGSGRALILEAKGWRSLEPRGGLHVVADGRVEVNPCYQLRSYQAKMTLLHAAAERISFDAAVYLYNAPAPRGLGCRVLARGSLRRAVEELPLASGVDEYVDSIVNGRLTISEDLISAISSALRDGLPGVADRLASKGYGLVGPQAGLVAEVMASLESGESGVFYLVEGTSGSGKTLIALTLFLEALARGYKALLGYVNNRLVNTLREALSESLGAGGRAIARLIGYSAVGPRKYMGYCESRHDYSKYSGGVDLLVLDEAQRLPRWALKTCPTRPARVIVAFYDDQQVLVGREAGTGGNLRRAAAAAGRRVREHRLPAPARVPPGYLKAVKSLLYHGDFKPAGVEVRVYDSITDLLSALRERYREGGSIALICAFTESEGDRDDKLSWNSIKNIRIGYPLQSGFTLYKGLNLKVKWLMDEKTEYPLYWRRDYEGLARLYGFKSLDPVTVCSSVYGAQGMEAEYVGVVWGRDLVWRNGAWTVNPEPITDTVGGRESLKNIAQRDPQRALELLRNRYYIMLTRPTKALYLFFEDQETKEHVENLLAKQNNN